MGERAERFEDKAGRTVLRPGLLVSLKTAIRGGVVYERRDLEDPDGAKELEAKGADVDRWETVRTIEDKEEHARAVKVRSRIRAHIMGACADTAFGPLCAEDDEGRLDARIEDSRGWARDFNDGAVHTRVSVFVLKGRVAETDEEATRAIADECAELLERMDRNAKDFLTDPAAAVKAIRDAATRAKEMEDLLEPAKAERLGLGIQAARAAAKEIQKRVVKDGEAAEKVLRDIRTAPIERARFAFLEIAKEEPKEAPVEALPSVEVRRFGGLDEPEVEARAV